MDANGKMKRRRGATMMRRFNGFDGQAAFGEKRLFITGGTGFFGKSMLDYRLRHPEWPWAKAEWVILSRSPERFAMAHPRLANQPGVSFAAGDVRDFAFPAGRFDAIIHAATSAVTTLSDAEMMSVIVDGARRVAEFAKTADCPRLLFTSSGAVYGPQHAPVDETAQCAPATAYGKGKLAAEHMLSDADLDVKIARCFAFVGPYLDRGMQYAIGNFIQNCLDGRSVVINGDGTPLRSYLYADDLVEWLFAILDRGQSRRVYNVGGEKAVSIRALAEMVRSALGMKVEIVVKQKPARDVPASVYVPVVDRAKDELGLQVRTPLECAVRKSAAFDAAAEERINA